jgi:hypothetical protein
MKPAFLVLVLSVLFFQLQGNETSAEPTEEEDEDQLMTSEDLEQQ